MEIIANVDVVPVGPLTEFCTKISEALGIPEFVIDTSGRFDEFTAFRACMIDVEVILLDILLPTGINELDRYRHNYWQLKIFTLQFRNDEQEADISENIVRALKHSGIEARVSDDFEED